MGTCEFDRLFKIRVLHIHEKIFFSLEYNSFKNCLEVCKSWHNVLTSESSQRWRKSVFREAIQEELRTTILSGKTGVVRQMLSDGIAEVDCMIRDKSNPLWLYTPLWVAAGKGHKDIVQLLLDAGDEPDKLDTDKTTPSRREASATSLGGGANPNIMESRLGTTPLHVASLLGHLDVAKLLLNAGSDPNKRALNGSTPLSWALTEVPAHVNNKQR